MNFIEQNRVIGRAKYFGIFFAFFFVGSFAQTAYAGTTTEQFTAATNTQTWLVPLGVTSIDILVWGAGGGGGASNNDTEGGRGGFASTTLAVTPGETLSVYVGGGGGVAEGGGGGGGYSGVFRSTTPLVIGGGGGGAGFHFSNGDPGALGPVSRRFASLLDFFHLDGSSVVKSVTNSYKHFSRLIIQIAYAVTSTGGGGDGGGRIAEDGWSGASGGKGGTQSAAGSGGLGGGNPYGSDGAVGSAKGGGKGGKGSGFPVNDTGGGGAGGLNSGAEGGGEGGGTSTGGGGGGGGYYGGGGGGAQICSGICDPPLSVYSGGGGGGSSYATGTATSTSMSAEVPGGYDDYTGGSVAFLTVGIGGIGLNHGYDGAVVFQYRHNILSGKLYSDEGVTPITTAKTIAIVVGTSTLSRFSTTTDAAGAWQYDLGITNTISSSTPILVWVDGDANTRAALFTKAKNSGGISGLDLYKNVVSIRHEAISGTTTSNAELGFYDNDNDSDIQYTSNSNNLITFAGQKLLVGYRTNYVPGGTVTTNSSSTAASPSGDFQLGASVSTSSMITLGGTLSIAGSYFASSSLNVFPIMVTNGYGVLFTATTTGKKILGTLTGAASFGSTTFNGAGGAWTFGSSASTTGNFTITNGAVTAPSGLLTIGGNYTNKGIFTANSGTTYFSSTTAQLLSGTLNGSSAFSSVSFLGASTKTFSSNASTTNNFTIGSGATVIAPPLLTIGGAYSNSGTFTHSSGTTYLTGVGMTSTGTMTGSSAWNHLTIGGGVGTEGYSTSFDFNELFVRSLVVDSTNGILYAGTGNNGIFYRCLLSTFCDAAGDWTVSYDTTEDAFYSLVIDSANGTLYAGTSPNGIIYRCALSTLCDAGGDWTISYDTAETYIYSLTIDSTNGVLYAGSSSGGIIYRCLLSTACDASGDWTVSYDTSESNIATLVVDSTNGVLYAGSGYNGVIYRCLLSTACDASGDWTVSYDTSETYINTITVDSTNGVLYAGSGDNGIIYGCLLSTACDASGDWTVSYDTSETSIRSFAIDPTIGTLYAGSSPGAIIFSKGTSTILGTNASTSDFFIESGRFMRAPPLLTIGGNYTNSGTFTSSGGSVYFSTTSTQTISGNATGSSAFSNFIKTNTGTTTFSSNASTTGSFTILTGTTTAPALLSIGGNYTNSGRFDSNSGLVYLNGTAQQTLSGNMIDSSSWNNLTILNNYGTNAQTNPGIIFGATSSTTGTFTATVASTSIRFPASATTSIGNLVLTGASAAAPIFFRSSTPGTYTGLSVSGTRSVTYADVKDSGACSGYANIDAVSSTNGGNNLCWTFGSSPILTILHYRWRMDHESEVSAGYYAAEDTALTNRIYSNDRIRLRTTIENTGSGAATDYNYRLEYASSSCTTWNNLGTTMEWFPDLTQYVNGYSSTTDDSRLSNPGGLTWQSGVFRAGTATTGTYTLPANYFTEHEFTINSTAIARQGINYCFRLTNAGSITNFTYTVQPTIMLRGDSRPTSGGQNSEESGAGVVHPGGGQGGGGGSEGGGGGGGHGGGGGGGGGGSE